MLSMKNTGLVQGVPLEGTPMVSIRALRGFFDQEGKPRQAGDLVQCTLRFAKAMEANGKAQIVPTVAVSVDSVEDAPARQIPESAPSEEPKPARRRR